MKLASFRRSVQTAYQFNESISTLESNLESVTPTESSQSMRACLIFNPHSGHADQIRSLFMHLNGDHRCELCPTTAAGDARRIARRAVEENFDRLIVAGGDGSIAEAISGIAPDFSAIELAVFPLGTGNDLARSLGISPDPIELACQSVFSDRTTEIDLIRISDPDHSYCVNVANGGVGGTVAGSVRSEDKQTWGSMAYWLSTFAQIGDLQQHQVQLTFADQQINEPMFGVAIANGRFVGGGFPIAPKALLNDGLIDITTIPVLPILELMATGFNLTIHREQLADRLGYYRAAKVQLHAFPGMPFSIDGEPIESAHCSERDTVNTTYEVLPQVLRVVVGEDPPGLSHREVP